MIRLLAALAFISAGLAPAIAADACDSLPSSAFQVESRGPQWEKRAAEKAERLDSSEALLLGDSIISRYPPDLQNKLSLYGVNNFGMAGDGVENLQWRLKNFGLKRTNATNIIFEIGGEDVGKMKPQKIAENIWGSICRLRNKLRYDSPYVRVVSILPQGRRLQGNAEAIAELNDILAGKAKRFGYTFVDANSVILRKCGSDIPCPLYADAYNLSEEGYRALTHLLDMRD